MQLSEEKQQSDSEPSAPDRTREITFEVFQLV